MMNHYKILIEQNRELKEQNDLFYGAVRYWRNLYHQKNDELAIIKDAIDEFLKRHPEFKAEFDEIIKLVYGFIQKEKGCARWFSRQN